MVQQIIVEMNTVLGTIIPGLAIDIHDFGEQLLANGEAGHKIELLSRRGKIQIPLKYESEGIIKIISILNVLMCVYNDPSMCLVIDELDAGIYEYLLGELLSVFEKGAKGQLIFTSHNLRALEMLNKTSILFSTTNPENRYMRLQNVKPTTICATFTCAVLLSADKGRCLCGNGYRRNWPRLPSRRKGGA